VTNPKLANISHSAVLCIIWGGLRAAQDEFEHALQLAEKHTGQSLRHLMSSATAAATGGAPPVSTVSATHTVL
jgi:hypothetical protein